MARPLEDYANDIEPAAIAADAAEELGLPQAFSVNSSLAMTRLANQMQRCADALERIATAEEARETRESGA